MHPGLRIAVVERQPADVLANPPSDGREIALTHRSVRLLQEMGACQHLDPAIIAPLRAARVLNGRSPFALSFDPAGGAQDWLGQLVPNHQLRRALYRTAFEAGDGPAGLELVAGVAVDRVRTGPAAARVTLADGRELRSRLLVAADSRFSKVREQLGITASINRLGRSMMVCRVAHDRDHGGVATEWFDHGQTIALLPLPGARAIRLRSPGSWSAWASPTSRPVPHGGSLVANSSVSRWLALWLANHNFCFSTSPPPVSIRRRPRPSRPSRSSRPSRASRLVRGCDGARARAAGGGPRLRFKLR
jgi:2-polyprenyl-6-methoxyphenol hydroxylase-like FAD-dependent oxidoreductase